MSLPPRASAKANKYGAVPTMIHGQRFASKKEARVWGELQVRERLGEIKKLERQKRYDLHVNGVKVCSYVADYVFYERFESQWPELQQYAWREIVADAKGVRTAVYSIKKKLMKAVLGYDIREY